MIAPGTFQPMFAAMLAQVGGEIKIGHTMGKKMRLRMCRLSALAGPSRTIRNQPPPVTEIPACYASLNTRAFLPPRRPNSPPATRRPRPLWTT